MRLQRFESVTISPGDCLNDRHSPEKMSFTVLFKFLVIVLCALLFLFGVGWTVWRALKNSDDPARLVFKWVLTVGMITFMILVVVPMMRRGGYEAAFGGVPLAAVCGMTLAIIWRHNIAEMFASPFGSLFDGGSQEFEARAFYSAAEKFRQRNQFHEAIAEVRKQLVKFPNDFHGEMLLAEINAENMQDLQSAEIIVQKMIQDPGRTAAQVSGALHALADWHMKLAQDPDSARLALEQIIERFPDSQVAQTAAQRIAHLGSVDSLLANHDRPTIALKQFDPHRSLEKETEREETLQQAVETRANVCLKQLEQFPLDTEAREKLAMIYAHDYQRLDLATEQLEQLVAQPNQRPRQISRWLNLLAELQIKIGNNVSGADKTVRRIGELFPGSAFAEQAVMRLEHLRLEAKRNEETQSIKLGIYEKDLGLKKRVD